ncbi:MAG TPA: ABC transporter permease [Gammaproteobacteria bacterium]|nr:ABC transporter permease [Gammaproteobacteria bacterium]
MVNLAETELAHPALELHDLEARTPTVKLVGNWNLRGFSLRGGGVQRELKELQRRQQLIWDLLEIEALDSVGAFVLWEAWGEKQPAEVRLRDEHRSLFERWKDRNVPAIKPPRHSLFGPFFALIEQWYDALVRHPQALLTLIGQAAIDTLWLIRHPRRIPWREISATIHEAGTRALPITAIVGILIGVVISYLSAVQLRGFGAEAFIVPILGVGILRELGPLLAAILVAGRSGSAMTAQFGVMRVTQELDALSTLGISPSVRLIWPKLVALGIAVPLLVIWTDAMALAGGIFSASLSLHISFPQFFVQLPQSVSVINLTLGLGKGVVFGVLIGLTACHFGMRVEPNTDSLGHETTDSVVTSITVVILADAVFAIVFQGAGMLR